MSIVAFEVSYNEVISQNRACDRDHRSETMLSKTVR